jgi:hypothetical protein
MSEPLAGAGGSTQSNSKFTEQKRTAGLKSSAAADSSDLFAATVNRQLFTVNPPQNETPDIPFVFFLENIFGVRNPPEAHKFPSIDGDFAEERNGRFGLDRIVVGLIENIEFLVAAPSRAGVEDRFRIVTGKIRITGVDTAEIG